MKVLVLVLNIWSWPWSRSWKKVLQFFDTFVVILDGSEQGTPWLLVRDNKSSLPFGSHCLREPSALRAHQPQLRGYLTMGLFVRLHRLGLCLGIEEKSWLQCIDCGKLLSLGSNKPGKQTVHGLKSHLEKCHKDIYTLYMMKVESRQQGPPAKKGETGRGIGGAL